MKEQSLEQGLIKKSRIKAVSAINDVTQGLIRRYKNNSKSFSYSSPLGQVILVIQNLVNNVYYYLTDVAQQTNFATANRLHTVYGLARLQGHNAHRGTSARGVIRLTVKPDLPSDLVGRHVFVPCYSKTMNLSNNLDYFINTSQDHIMIDVDTQRITDVQVIQGTPETHTMTGTSESLQTYEIPNVQYQMFDNDFIEVEVNGQPYDVYDSLYDIPYGKAGVLVKTGMTSGIDLMFGKAGVHQIPETGQEIRVTMITTAGRAGNVLDKNTQWKLTDICYDAAGNEHQLEEIFEAKTIQLPSLGSDPEDMELTRVLAPNVSRSFVIYDRRSITYFFQRLNFFSSISVSKRYEDGINHYDVLLLPQVTQRLLQSEDYFNVPVERFSLTTYEKDQLMLQLKESGAVSAGVAIDLIEPTFRRFAMFVYIRLAQNIDNDPTSQETIKTKIRATLSRYFLQQTDPSRIIHSDVVSVLHALPEIYSVRVVFLAEDPKYLDTLGNVIVQESEVALCRGGFRTRDGIDVSDSFSPNDNTGSVNIVLNSFEQVEFQ